MQQLNPLDSMLDQAQSALSCPVCHRSFERNELRLRGMFERHGIVQASCSQEHNPTVVIFVADEHGAKSTVSKEQRITANDVLELHHALESFDGNFRNALKPQSK